MSNKNKWYRECKMTCLGGSEQGTCQCKGSYQCLYQNDPEYMYYRQEAMARIQRHLNIVLEN
jgi:hypothetical protein